MGNYQTSINIDDITINPEYAKLVPPHSPEKYEDLKQSIKENGLYEPITVNKKNEILDGHHRFRACKETGVMPRVGPPRGFDSEGEELLYIIDANLHRRQLSVFQEVELREKRERIKSGENYDASLPRKGQKGFQKVGENNKLMSVSNDTNTKRTRGRIAASMSNTGEATISRAFYVLDHAPEEIKEKTRLGKDRGGISIFNAYKKTKQLTEKPPKPIPLPKGIYNVIYADPPWRYDFSETYSRSIPAHYADMSLQDICTLDIPSADNSVLFLWATNPKILEAFQVIKAWGYTYKTNLVWIKDKIGMGYWVRGQHELLLIATKGKFKPPKQGVRTSSVLKAPRTKHSQKPSEVYDIIEKYFPNGKYLELFARNTREKWEPWGNEI